MSNLDGNQIKDTYGGLMNVGPSGAADTTLRQVTDGFGNPLPIQISSTTVSFTGSVTGITGAAGTSGTSGTSGEAGTSGTSGVDGNAGTSGTSGVSGDNGTSGTSGVNGDNGTSGTSGVNGNAGTSGTSGVNGDNGTSGVDGNAGTSGTSGVDGNAGTSGTSGVNGDNGTSGTSGTSGEDFAPLTINTQTTDYTLVLSDSGKTINMNNSTGTTITVGVPVEASVNFPTGTQILIVRGGTGEVAVSGDIGVTVDSVEGHSNLQSQYSGATLLKNGSDSWWLFGNLKV